jgi:hypothetical protein
LGVVRVAKKFLEGNIGHGFEGEKIGVIHTLLTVSEAGPPELEGPADEEPAEVLLDMGGVEVAGEQVGNTVDEDRLGPRHMEAMVFGDGLEFGEFVLTEADSLAEILMILKSEVGDLARGDGGSGGRGAFTPGGGDRSVDGGRGGGALGGRVDIGLGAGVRVWVEVRPRREEVEHGGSDRGGGDIREDIVCDHN